MIELAAGEVSYGTVDPSVFQINAAEERQGRRDLDPRRLRLLRPVRAALRSPKLTTHGHGIDSIAVLEAKEKGNGSSSSSSLESLPKVKIGSATASELRTALGTILTFERGGVRYVLAGAVAPAAVEALARGL